MKALICGGRTYNDRAFLFDTLDRLGNKLGITSIVQGGAAGADALAREWARNRVVPCETYHADWNAYGRAAGPIRNREMIRDSNPGVVIAFAGGRGTNNLVNQALALDIPTYAYD
jgi:hypothetical protein